MTVATCSSAKDSSAENKALLSKEFKAVGLNPKGAFEVMPEWWQDAIVGPSGVYEIRGFVAKYFCLDIGPDGKLRRRNLPQACFKNRSGVADEDVASARAFATAVAGTAASITTTPWKGSLPSAEVLRREILDGGCPWVGLADLLSICWAHGAPVVYLPKLPVCAPKMEGMLTFCAGRPAVVVTKKATHPAWLLFIIAHEMGHLAFGHLPGIEGEIIVDEKISEDDPMSNDQEKEANSFALELLTGNSKGIPLKSLMKAEELAEAAKSYGGRYKIDPGHVILNAVRNYHGKPPWPLANAALKHIGHDEGPAEKLCRTALRRYVDVEELPDDGFNFIERLGLI
ncbi:HTH-type transcriptional regulator / antitoxin HigA [Azospirillaceae bacterium]